MKTAIVIALVALSGIATAETAPIVVESYGSERPADAAKLLAPMFDELGQKGFTQGSALADTLAKNVSRSGAAAADSDLAAAKTAIDAGYSSFLKGDFQRALGLLTGALDTYRARPATLARNQGIRDGAIKAYLGLALTYQRLGRGPDAESTMAEFARSFPDREISRSQYGPEPAELAKRVRAELEQRGTGTLHIKVDDPTVVVFLNERYLGVGETTAPDLYPGRYRVFTQKGTAPGRVHEIEVTPATEQRLEISWAEDGSLRSEPFVGLVFESEEARAQHEAAVATRLATAAGATSAVVISIRRYESRRAIVGTVLSADSGKASRTATVALEPATPGDSQLRGLARFLAGGEAGPGVQVLGEPDGNLSAPARAAHARAGRPYRPWKWLALGSGVVAAGLGAYFLAIDGQDKCKSCTDRYATATSGYVSLGAGAVLIGAGIVLWIKDKPQAGHEQRSGMLVAPTRTGWLLGWHGTL